LSKGGISLEQAVYAKIMADAQQRQTSQNRDELRHLETFRTQIVSSK
jgi:hypothetical protein